MARHVPTLLRPIFAVALSFAVSCDDGGAVAPVDSSPPDADAIADSAPRRDSGRLPPLPTAEQQLPPARYDCSAAGPFVAAPRPYVGACHSDPDCTTTLVAAHRMGTPFAPENSLSALRASILLGVDIVETDVRLSADGEVVLMHDSSVDRTTDGEGDVSAMTLAELRELPLIPRAAVADGDFSCDRAPTLAEVFAISRGEIVVELEVKDEAAGVLAAEYLRDEALYDDAFLLCDESECAAARVAVPDVPIMSRPREPAEVAGAVAYDPPPVLVHIDVSDEFLAPVIVDQLRAVGARIYANAFVLADPQAALSADLSGYQEIEARGIDVLQSEFPHWALMGLGRLEP